MHELYNTNIRCNKKFMFYKDHGIGFSINNNNYTKIKKEYKNVITNNYAGRSTVVEG